MKPVGKPVAIPTQMERERERVRERERRREGNGEKKIFSISSHFSNKSSSLALTFPLFLFLLISC
jgi:hypothetical protein